MATMSIATRRSGATALVALIFFVLLLNYIDRGAIAVGPRGAGTFVGIQNATGNLSGIVGPILTGVIIDRTGHYDNAFWITAGVALAGALAWWKLVPSIRPINFAPSDVSQSKL